MRIKEKNKKSILMLGICIMVAASAGFMLGSHKASEYLNKTPLDEDTPLVRTAVDQVGEEDGEKYWNWYGFDFAVDWCACFVSWCVNENKGEYENEMEPFCYVPSGVNWFMENNQWKNAGATPDGGDIIFFDWDCSGIADHVGIVTGTDENYVYTVEGNSRDMCRRKAYPLNCESILGYGQLK